MRDSTITNLQSKLKERFDKETTNREKANRQFKNLFGKESKQTSTVDQKSIQIIEY